MSAIDEPPSMTLGDVLALVVGVALAMSLAANIPELPFFRSPSGQLVHSAIRSSRGLSLAVSVVVLARTGRYRRMPSAPEWLAILAGVSLLTERPEFRVDSYVSAYFRAFPSRDSASYIGMRWGVAGLFSVVLLVGLGTVYLASRLLPTWLKTLLLAWLAIVAMAGPLWVFGEHGADLLTPSGGFGPGSFSTLHRGACLLVAASPMGLLYGVPAMAALIERSARRRWTWVEWASMTSASLTGTFATMLYRGEFAPVSAAWIVERLLVLAWLLAVAWASRWILIRFFPAWDRP